MMYDMFSPVFPKMSAAPDAVMECAIFLSARATGPSLA